MDNARADIIAGIRELRAKAAEQLTGNDYYMIVQQLDSLAADAELSDDAARSMMSLVSAKLQGGAPGISVGGGPEVPSPPDTPAQPDTPSTPEEPVIPDSPAQPDNVPGPDVPSPPSSPAEPPPAPPEISASAAASGSEAPIQIIKPRANSFGLPQATVGVRFDESAEPPAAPTGGWTSAVLAVRALVEQSLSGNSYYAAANLLGQLQILPPAVGRGEAARPDGFEGALALLRREAAHLTGTAHDEAARIIAALDHVLIPPVVDKPAEAAAPGPSASVEPQAEAAMPEPDTGPRTGFDDLADAAWRRVQQVSAADVRPAGALNGASPSPIVAEAEAAAPAPVAPVPAAEAQDAGAAITAEAPAELMQQDNGEAFNDGGFESRSSEPCYLYEFEAVGARHGQSDREKPSAEAGTDAPSETQCPAAVPAEAPDAPLNASPGSGSAPEQAANAASETVQDAPAETGAEAEAPPVRPARRGLLGRLFGGAAPKVAEIR